jgi:hypothetical protein
MTTNNLIQFDHSFPECTAIDTEEWLSAVLGSEVLEGGELEELLSQKWLMQCEDEIKEAIELEEGQEYKCTGVDNTYNNENDFSSQFQWQVFYPADGHGDWCWERDCYVAIEVHQGGDVRGNYGRVRLFKIDSLADAGFLDWVLGWNVSYASGEEVAENERFSIGYHSLPYAEMERHLKGRLMWSEKRECFVGWYQDGRAIEARPYLYVS